MPTSPLFAVPMLEGGSDYPTPDSTADAKQINDQFKYAEQFWGVKEVTSGTLPSSPKNQQLIYESDTGRLRYWDGTTWVTVSPPNALRGTTAARDAAFPTPANAAARVALAAQVPLWFNTEKGYEQQYFAQFDDAGAGIFSRKTHGWRASLTAGGRVPISVFTASGATPANVKKYGSSVEVIAATTTVFLDGCFTTDFDAYDIDIEVHAAATSGDMTFQFRAAGALSASALYDHERIGAAAASLGSLSVTNATSWTVGSVATNTSLIRMRITNPASATDFKRMEFAGGNGSDSLLQGIGRYRSLTALDGLQIGNGGNLTRATIRVYGVSNGL